MPAEDLQSQLLADFHDTVVPNLIAPSPFPVPVWVTPPSRDPRFNGFYILNALQHRLVPCPGRLRVFRVGEGVFKVMVSSQNIANVLVIRGALRFCTVDLFFHHSLAAAREAGASLRSARWRRTLTPCQLFPPHLTKLLRLTSLLGPSRRYAWELCLLSS